MEEYVLNPQNCLSVKKAIQGKCSNDIWISGSVVISEYSTDRTDPYDKTNYPKIQIGRFYTFKNYSD